MLQLETIPLKTLTLQFADSFNQKDLNAIAELFHEDFCLHDPVLKWVRGKNTVLELFGKQFAEASQASYKAVNLFQERNATVLEFIIRIGAEVRFGVDLIDWRGGKMAELRRYYYSN